MVVIISLILAFLGFLDATYLTILHIKHIIPPCTFAHTCDIVLTSKYATIAGVPIALLGSLFYITIMALLALLIQFQKTQNTQSVRDSENLKVRKSDNPSFPRIVKNALLIILSLGLIVSVALVYIQAYVIHAFCQYCLTSEGINTLLFFCALFIWRKNSNKI